MPPPTLIAPVFARRDRAPAAPQPRTWLREPPLFCPCGHHEVAVAGLCRRCYDRVHHSTRAFEGLRFAALQRDDWRCAVCHSAEQYVVHHRRPDIRTVDDLLTLCTHHHGIVTHLAQPTAWLPPLLLTLWREQHPDGPYAGQFDFGDWPPDVPAWAPRLGAEAEPTPPPVDTVAHATLRFDEDDV